jgi:hypothetical protein
MKLLSTAVSFAQLSKLKLSKLACSKASDSDLGQTPP